LVDIDHIAYLDKEERKIYSFIEKPGHVDWLHTVWGLIAATINSLILFNFLPLLSFIIHILIDGGNSSIRERPDKGPLLTLIHPFYPKWLTYRFKA
jgi:hypothetical protein